MNAVAKFSFKLNREQSLEGKQTRGLKHVGREGQT